MRYKLLFIFLIMLSGRELDAQAIRWQTCYDPDSIVGKWDDYGNGLLFYGTKVSANGTGDFWLSSWDLQGNMISEKFIGGSDEDGAVQAIKLPTGELLLIGNSFSADGDIQTNFGGSDIIVMKLRSDWSIEWVQNYGGSNEDYARMAQLLADSTLMVVGETYSSDGDLTGSNYHADADVWILKIDMTGHLIHNRVIGGSDYENVHEMRRTDSLIYLLGKTNSFDGDFQCCNQHDFVVVLNTQDTLIKLDATTSTGSDNSVLYATKPGFIQYFSESAGSQILSCLVSDSLHPFSPFYFPETNCFGSNGDVHLLSAVSFLKGILVLDRIDTNGSFVSVNYGSGDLWLALVDPVFHSILWETTLGGSDDDAPNLDGRILISPTGNIIVLSSTWSNDIDVHGNHGKGDIWIAELNSHGQLLRQKCFGGSDIEYFSGDAKFISDGTLLLTAGTLSTDGDVSCNTGNWVIDVSGLVGIGELHSGEPSMQIYPQPASTSVHLSMQCNATDRDFNLQVFSLTGEELIARRMKTTSANNQIFEGELGIENLVPGYYILRLTGDDSFIHTVPLIVQ